MPWLSVRQRHDYCVRRGPWPFGWGVLAGVPVDNRGVTVRNEPTKRELLDITRDLKSKLKNSHDNEDRAVLELSDYKGKLRNAEQARDAYRMNLESANELMERTQREARLVSRVIRGGINGLLDAAERETRHVRAVSAGPTERGGS